MKTLAALTLAALVAPAVAVGAGGPDEIVRVAVGLKRDTAGLQAFATAVSTPGGPADRDYATVPALAARVGATAATGRQARAQLRRIGVTSSSLDVTRGFLIAPMTAAQASTATQSTSLRRSGAVTAITVGAPVPQPMGAREQGASATPPPGIAWPSRTGTATGCAEGRSVPIPRSPADQAAFPNSLAFTPNQLQTAFGFTPLHRLDMAGAGTHIALFEVDAGIATSDMTAYAACFGLPAPDLHIVPVGQSSPIDPATAGATDEATLDVQAVMAVAPRARISVVEGTAAASFPEVLSAALDARRMKGLPDVISVSYGVCESVVQGGGVSLLAGPASRQLTDWVAAAAAGAGVSVVTSAGDSGAAGCAHLVGAVAQADPQALMNATTNWASYPATSPWFTSVGGIDMTLTRGNAIRGASVWNDATRIGLPALTPVTVNGTAAYAFTAGSGGGGSSLLYGRPGYQAGFGITSARRLTPDVSMFAARGFAIYCSAGTPGTALGCGPVMGTTAPWASVAGTSLAAPLLAGAVALANRGGRTLGAGRLGFLNPLLYGPASPGVTDVVNGNNDTFGTGRCCYAGPGYDQATGLGLVRADRLFALGVWNAG